MDTLHIEMADEEGNWLGKGNSGSYYQLTQHTGVITLYAADSVLQIVPLMKDNVLKGVHDVGIRLSTFASGVNAQKNEK